jgi:hypothetical protein
VEFKEDEVKQTIEELRQSYNGCGINIDQLRINFQVEGMEHILRMHDCKYKTVKFSWSPGIGGIAKYEEA